MSPDPEWLCRTCLFREKFTCVCYSKDDKPVTLDPAIVLCGGAKWQIDVLNKSLMSDPDIQQELAQEERESIERAHELRRYHTGQT